jgi:hypothetical protein
MLLYHPFFDAHHCLFRMLRLLAYNPEIQVEVDRFRVWDFYLLFPSALENVTLPQSAQRIRRIARAKQNRYEVLPDVRRAFARLKPIQDVSLGHLSFSGYINALRFGEGIVVRSNQTIPRALLDRLKMRNDADAEIVSFLTTTFFEVPLYGKGGIRYRTDLFDRRYDVA